MSIYSNALKYLRNSMVKVNNFTAISMWASIVIGIIGSMAWLINSFFDYTVFNVISLVFAIGYATSFLMVIIGHILMDRYEKKYQKVRKLYKAAKNRLFDHNISIANELYERAV